MDKEEKKTAKMNLSQLNSLNYLYVLSFDEIISIFRNNKKHMPIYKQNYIELEKSYSKYYNLNTRKKLNSIVPLLQESLPTFLSKIKNDNKLSLEGQLNNLYYVLSDD